jgi:hypothetical protein
MRIYYIKKAFIWYNAHWIPTIKMYVEGDLESYKPFAISA